MSDVRLQKMEYVVVTHRNQEVILCKFPYDPNLLSLFRKEFPSAKWSRTFTSWYLPNSTLYRKRLRLELPEIGDQIIPKLYNYNREQFILYRNALTQRKFSDATLKTYLNEFAQLLIILKQHPVDQLTPERLNSYFLYCIKKLNHSENQVYSRMNAIKTYFKLVLHKEAIFETVIRPKATKSLPKILSKQEIKRLFETTTNLKHLLILKMAYGMGLRVSELIELKVSDLFSERNQVHIRNSKGKKDRYVNLPESLKGLLEDYLRAYQPKNFLFEGQFQEQYTTRSAQSIFKNAMNKAKISRSVGIHGLRHSYATHLLDAGTDMIFIQKLLGHSNIKTTEVYAKISNKVLSNVQSPLDTF